jgi:hypothetical protein
MRPEYTTAGTGMATGAASGAMAGTAIMPGVGTAVGAGVGALIGGASGYMSGRGASKKARALEQARARYEAALRQHQTLSEAAANGYRGSVSDLLNQNQNSYAEYLKQMPGDQTASLQNDYANQVAALGAAGNTGAALQGPLAQQYAAEGGARTATALSPIALQYSADQQGQSILANRRQRDLSALAIQSQGATNEQRYGLGQVQRDADLARAQAAYARETGDAQSVGDRQMLYGALMQQGLNLGAQGAMAYGRPALKPTAKTNRVFSEDDMNSWYSRVPNNNQYAV